MYTKLLLFLVLGLHTDLELRVFPFRFLILATSHSFQCSYRYPFVTDSKCKRPFALCLATNHMARMVVQFVFDPPFSVLHLEIQRPEDRDGLPA